MVASFDIVQSGTIAYIPGALGLAAQLTWPLMRSRRAILLVQAGIGLGYSAQYALLGAWSGAAVAGLGGAQTLMLLFAGPQHARLVAFAVFPLLLAFGAFTWSGVTTLLALLACGLIMLGRLQRDTLRLRQIQLAAAPVGMTHDLIVGAYPALLGALASAAVASLALRRELRSRSRKPESRLPKGPICRESLDDTRDIGAVEMGPTRRITARSSGFMSSSGMGAAFGRKSVRHSGCLQSAA